MLSRNANKIFKLKYALDGEEWIDTCTRVADYVASVEDDDVKRKTWANRFCHLIFTKSFIPGGRILANADTKINNLLNCFVLPIEDSRQSIYEALRDAAELFAHGGGVGFNFSNIREEGADIKFTGGKASGPISFMGLFDQTGEVIQQASRRGAQIGILDVNHPDIQKFIDYKSIPNRRSLRLLSEYKRNLLAIDLDVDYKEYFHTLGRTLCEDQLSHFNISVMLNDKFMSAVINDDYFRLRSRSTGKIKKRIKAKRLLSKIALMAYKSGDPGFLFYDRINEFNLVPYMGDVKAVNPCGEVGLLSYEACCLGSINLKNILKSDEIDWEYLEYITRIAIRFLDNVQTITESPLNKVNEMCKGLRRLGLGVMGLADLLAELEIPYDSEEALNLSKRISWFISYFAWQESINIAEEKGAFPLYDKKRVDLSLLDRALNPKSLALKFDIEDIRKTGVRNVGLTSIAPTGTIALLADVNSGIEPFFALSYKRNITEGIGNTAKDSMLVVNSILKKKLEKYNLDSDKIISEISETGTLQNLPKNLDRIKAVFKSSHEISPTAHVNMQAVWQKYTDNSISKTINMPENSSVEDIEKIIIDMWNKNLKGGTIYRNKSRNFQILDTEI